MIAGLGAMIVERSHTLRKATKRSDSPHRVSPHLADGGGGNLMTITNRILYLPTIE